MGRRGARYAPGGGADAGGDAGGGVAGGVDELHGTEVEGDGVGPDWT
jgi:hypothetical protein